MTPNLLEQTCNHPKVQQLHSKETNFSSSHSLRFRFLKTIVSTTPRISGLKSQVLKPTFLSKNDGKKGCRFFLFWNSARKAKLAWQLAGVFEVELKKI